MTSNSATGGPLIAIVGPCASGKSTLAEALRAEGYNARQIAQEHSYVPSMWELITNPDLLVYLDADFETCTRRKSLSWSVKEYQTQIERLTHARQHCDLYIDTTDLSPLEVARATMEFLRELS